MSSYARNPASSVPQHSTTPDAVRKVHWDSRLYVQRPGSIELGTTATELDIGFPRQGRDKTWSWRDGRVIRERFLKEKGPTSVGTRSATSATERRSGTPGPVAKRLKSETGSINRSSFQDAPTAQSRDEDMEGDPATSSSESSSDEEDSDSGDARTACEILSDLVRYGSQVGNRSAAQYRASTGRPQPPSTAESTGQSSIRRRGLHDGSSAHIDPSARF